MKTVKDWDQILDEISSGGESDEHDTPNIVGLKKHGPKLMEMVSNIVETRNLNPEIMKAQMKAKANTSCEPVMENFNSIRKEISETIEKKKLKKTPNE